jgi:AcrR family transcriptional regulator
MPRPRKIVEETREMRERILDAAFELLQQEGLEGISIRRIAEAVGVSHMSLYRYFENRAAIIKALRERGLEEMQAFCDASLRRAEDGDALDQVRQSLKRFIELSHDHPRLYQLAWRRSSDDTSFRVDSRNLSRALGHLSRLIALGIERGQCVKRDPTLAAAMAFCIVNGTLMLHHNVAAINQVDRAALEREMIEAAVAYLTQAGGTAG